jgi:hypothetical protein
LEEFGGGLHQPDHAFLHQILERDGAEVVLLGDADDQTQVRLDQLLLGLQIPLADALGQLDLLLVRQETAPADRRQAGPRRAVIHRVIPPGIRPRAAPAALEILHRSTHS